MVAPKFGLYTQGVQQAGDTVTFEYFSVDGDSTGCPPVDENEPPAIEAISATPTSGFAPLAVKFDVTASDEDDDDLTYSWDFNGDGTADSTSEDPTYTYTTAGTFEAKVTVSDGEDTRTRTVTVTVFGADDLEARFRVLVFSKTTGFRHDSIPAGIAAIKALGTANDFQVDAPRTRACSTRPRWPTTTRSSSCRPRAIRSTPRSRRRSRTTSRAAVATWVSTRRPTPSTSGASTAVWWARTSATTRPARPPRRSGSRTRITTRRRVSRTRGAAWTSGTTTSRRSTRLSGGGDDYSPRGQVHVLLTVDEATYGEEDGNTTDDDHPISWCQRYQGGRSWYTGMGHTQATFSEAPFLKHLLSGLEIAAGVQADADCGKQGGNQPPTVSIQRNPAGDVYPGDPVAFTATASDPDGDTLTYEWDFGDGGTATTKDAMHTYTEPGVWFAKVTVRDGKGGRDQALVQVNVQPFSENEEEVGVGGRLVPGTLALDIKGSANLGVFTPGVAKDYTASLTPPRPRPPRRRC